MSASSPPCFSACCLWIGIALLLIVGARPASAQQEHRRALDGPPDAVQAPAARYFVQLRTLGGVTRSALPVRNASEMPPTLRYALGGTFAAVSLASLGGSVWLGVATVRTLQSDSRLRTPLGIVSSMATAGSVGLAVATGVWSVRLFRGQEVLTVP